jgi:PAS domain S-box-containing protein
MGLRVLLADDDEVSRGVMRHRLRAWNYDVVECQNGLDALTQLQAADAPPLAILDWIMPGLDGPEVCRRVRADERPVYIILLTTKSKSGDVISGLSSGADDHLSKQLPAGEMRARIEAGSRIAALQCQVAHQLDLLRLQHERLHALVANSPLAIAAYDPSGRVQMWNAAAERLFGWPEAEILGRPNPVVPAEKVGESSLLRSSALRGKPTTGAQVQRQTKDGRLVDVSLSTAATRDLKGAVTGVMTIFQDITREKAAERELLQAHEETERLFSAIASVLIGLDADGRITRWNDAARRAFDRRAADVLGRRLIESDIQWDHRTLEEHVAVCQRQQLPVHLNEFTYLRGATPRVLHIVLTAVTEGRQAGGVLLLATDVTEHRFLQTQLSHAQKLEAIGQLAAGLAHEINTPMQYVGNNLGFLHEHWPVLREVLEHASSLRASRGEPAAREQAIDALCQTIERADLAYLLAETPEALSQALEGVERVARLVREMKTFSHPGEQRPSWVDINRAVEGAIVVARHEWKAVCDLVTDLSPSLPLVACLPAEINQVVLNLLVNATHAIADTGAPAGVKGRIVISTRREDNAVVIDIADTGTGIPASIRGRVFDPFFTTKDVGRGTGQGLALAHYVVVQQHRGRIWFDTEEGTGTVFHVRLPVQWTAVAS